MSVSAPLCRCTCEMVDGPERGRYTCELSGAHDGRHKSGDFTWPNYIASFPQVAKPWWKRTYAVPRWVVWAFVPSIVIHGFLGVRVIVMWLS